MQHSYRLVLGLALASLSLQVHAQNTAVGIGTTTPDANAALDISSGSGFNKGLLIPRMSEVQRINVTTTSEGMLVYQTNGAQPGFWYFSGGVWVALPSGVASGAGWLRTGNSGTDPGVYTGVGADTNAGSSFVGTTDNKDLVFRTANNEKLRITTDGSLYSRSTFGLILNARDAPMLTRGWNPFQTGDYAGLGRWGVFMLSSRLAFGIPANMGSFSWVSWRDDSKADKNLMTLKSNGNLGIGITNPATRLSVVGTGTGNPNAAGPTQSNGQYARFRDATSTVLDLGGSGTGGNWIQSTDSLNLATNYALRLNPNGGNVGVGGTAAPTSSLSVTGSVATSFVTTGTATGFTLTGAHRTVRRLAACTAIALPAANASSGRLYTIINAAASSVALTAASGTLYDDVTESSFTALAAKERITLQSDGTNWIVVGR